MKGYSTDKTSGPQKHVTLQPIAGGKHAADMVPKAVALVTALDQVPSAGTVNSIEVVGHVAKAFDVIRFTGGVNENTEVSVSKVDANNIFLYHKFDAALTAADTFKIMRYVTLTITPDGELVTSSGPIRFIKDAVSTQVLEDTGTPANTVALPVKLMGLTGEINVTAGDLNVQTSHTGANPDSVRVGNGTNELGINANLEALTHDTDLLAEQVLQKALLTSLDGKDFSTEAKQDVIITALAALNTKSVHEAIFVGTQALTTAGFVSIGAVIPAGTTIKEIEIFYKDGSTIEVFDDNAGNSLGMVTQAGGKIPVNVVGDNALRIHLQVKGADVAVDDLTVNLIK